MMQRENEIKQTQAGSGDENLYDLSILLEMDDKEYVIEMVDIFLKDTPAEIKEIEEAVVAGNMESVYKKAHKLKSSAGILQANNLVDLLCAIERNAKSQKAIAELPDLLEQARHEYRKLEQALQKLLKNLRA